ncbi:hypothetical protein PG991_014384 [Apiospora marii]|uniref:Uncharacterized protein n=1 Tax=Apiospora marii TaxID=335849 RepID=A0ABR1R9H1_9PEZI
MHFAKPIVSSLAVVGAAAQPLATTRAILSPTTLATVVAAPTPSAAINITFQASGAAPKLSAILPPEFGSGFDIITEHLLVESLKNTQSKDLAKQCQGVNDRVFLDKLLGFLSNFKLVSSLPKSAAPKDILEHLVMYVGAFDQMEKAKVEKAKVEKAEVEKAKMEKAEMPFRFPEAIAGLLRGALGLARHRGALQGDSLEVVQPLDTIFNDVCAGTGKAAEKVSVVYRHIAAADSQF